MWNVDKHVLCSYLCYSSRAENISTQSAVPRCLSSKAFRLICGFCAKLFFLTQLGSVCVVRAGSHQHLQRLCKAPALKYSAHVSICIGTKSPPLSLWAVLRTVNILALTDLPLGRKAITAGFHVHHSSGLQKPCIRDGATPPSIVAPSCWDEKTPDLGGKFNLKDHRPGW